MDVCSLGKHTIYIQLPENGLKRNNNCAVFLNDGELISKLSLRLNHAILFGIVPNDRLTEYTPWKQKAIRSGASDFGGKMEEYHHTLRTEILPTVQQEYHLDSSRLAYGGFSLGGLAAIMSLWQTNSFCELFSISGSFWYPGVVEFMEKNQILNRKANVFLLNGEKEGEDHNNRLQNASGYAKQVHTILKTRLNARCVMDEYAHHEQQIQRFGQIIEWLEQQFIL